MYEESTSGSDGEDGLFTIVGGKEVPLFREPRAIAVKIAPQAERSLGAHDVLDKVLGPERREQAFIAEHGLKVYSVDNALDARFLAGPAADDALETLNSSAEVDYATPVFRQSARSSLPVYVSNKILLKFKDDVSPEQQAALHAELGGSVVRALGYTENGFLVELRGPAAGRVVQIANAYATSPLVEWANPDFIKRIAHCSLRADYPTLGAAAVARSAEERWHLDRIGIEAAWAVTRGSSSVKVAITDDGVDVDHPEFAGRVTDHYDFATHTADGRPKVAAGDRHGTPVASVAVAAGIRAHGAAPACPLMAIRTPGFLGTSDEAEMFRWCADRDAAVVNCSWGPPDGEDAFPLADATRSAIDYCVERGRGGRGTPVVFAAGNGDEPVAGDGYASHSRVIAVAACNSEDERSWYSDYGPQVFVTAPSSGGRLGIFTADRRGSAGYNPRNGGPADLDYYDAFGGTSSAAPLVAGVIGLILSANQSLSESEVREILRTTTDRIGDSSEYDAGGHHPHFGYGRVNAARAVAEARRRAGSGPQQPGAPTIAGPARLTATGAPPSFDVDTGGRRFFAVEVATDAALFDADAAEARRNDRNFYGSWTDGLSDRSPYRLPETVWRRLDLASGRLAYRVHVAEDSEWSNYAVSTPDERALEAPVITIEAASGGPDDRPGNGPFIRAEAQGDRGGSAPVFEVDKGGRRLYAVEIATEAVLFDANAAGHRRAADNFFASWQEALSSRVPFVMPEEAWDRLRPAARLFYRAHFADDEAWTNYTVTVPDTDADRAPSMALDGGFGLGSGGGTPGGDRPRIVVFPSGARFDVVPDAEAPDYVDTHGGDVPLIAVAGRGGERVSASFRLAEYVEDGDRYARLDPALVEAVEAIRSRLGAAVVVERGYLRPAVDATHATGRKVAIRSRSASADELAELADRVVRTPFTASSDGRALVLDLGAASSGALMARTAYGASALRTGAPVGINLIGPAELEADEGLQLFVETTRRTEVMIELASEAGVLEGWRASGEGAVHVEACTVDGAGVFIVPDAVLARLREASLIFYRAVTRDGRRTRVQTTRVASPQARSQALQLTFRTDALIQAHEEAVLANRPTETPGMASDRSSSVA